MDYLACVAGLQRRGSGESRIRVQRARRTRNAIVGRGRNRIRVQSARGEPETRSLGKIDFPLSLPFLRLQAMEYCNYRIDPHSITLIPAKLYKLIAILRQQFCIILTASWKKIPITGSLLRRQYVVILTSLKQSKETENHDTILYSPLTAKRFTFI